MHLNNCSHTLSLDMHHVISLPGITTKYTTRTPTFPQHGLKVLPVNVIEDQIDEKVVAVTQIDEEKHSEARVHDDWYFKMFLEF